VGGDRATKGQAVADAERAVETMFGQLTEGLAYIRDRSFGGVVAVATLDQRVRSSASWGSSGPKFATTTLDLGNQGFRGRGPASRARVVAGIVALNAYGHRLPRRRTIEAGMITMGILLAILSFAGPISRFLEDNVAAQIAESSRVVSVLSLVVVIAFLVGFAFAIVLDSFRKPSFRKSCLRTSGAGCSAC